MPKLILLYLIFSITYIEKEFFEKLLLIYV